MALVAVLWVVALLSMMAAIFAAETRTETDLARNLVENAQAEALADAGVYRAIAMLLDPDRTRVPRVGGTPSHWAVGSGEVVVSIQDEGGKVDLNAAPDDLLQALFVAIGVAPGNAAAMVSKIRDFTDRDHIRRPGGAEDEDYRLAGAGHDAKDAPFDSVAELEQVLGMTHELFARLERLLTVYSGAQHVNPLTASPELLALLPDIATARRGAFVNLDSGAAGSEVLRAVTIRGEARTSAGGVFRREAVVLLTSGPFAIREWRRSWNASPARWPIER